jgi:hypothetical protein
MGVSPMMRDVDVSGGIGASPMVAETRARRIVHEKCIMP